MCGIAGLWQRNGASGEELERATAAMTQAVCHRGPDDVGIWIDERAGLGLGQRRLSIIDLSPAGHQPMASADGRFVITYNGEIYNFLDLRRTLEQAGVRFRGQSDTEVIVESCARIGVEPTLALLNGMFALAIWDIAERRLFLARDRMGEKPLYWTATRALVMFGSELKSLRAHPRWRPRLNHSAVTAFLRHNYVPGPFTIYEDVFKLPPGGVVVIESQGEATLSSYWRLDEAVERGQRDPLPGNEEELTDSLEALLQDAVSRRMISDVPLGAFLSGGYDSSMVVALMQKAASAPIKTFTISFDKAGFDEAPHAEAVAAHLGTDHTTFSVTGAEALAVVPRLAQMYDEPFADSSQIPTIILSAHTRKRVTVALSGDGGDELFSGYNRYQWARTAWRSTACTPAVLRRSAAWAIHSVPMGWYDRVARGVPYVRRIPQIGHKAYRYAQTLKLGSVDEVYYRLVCHHESPSDFVKKEGEARSSHWSEKLDDFMPDPVDRMRYLDMRTYLPDDILTKVDRASMAVALEVRVPLLDHRLVEWVWRLPPSLNARAARPKHLLRRVLERHVPGRLLDRPKMGFGVPLADWLRGPLREWTEDLMSESSLRAGDVLHAGPVRDLWADLQGGNDRYQYLVWNLVMFQSWQRHWGRTSAAPERVAPDQARQAVAVRV